MAMSEALRRAAMARFDALEAKMFRSSKLCLAIAFQRLRFSFCRVYRWKARGQALQNGVRQVLPFPAVGELWGREESVGVFLNFRTRFLSFRNGTPNRQSGRTTPPLSRMQLFSRTQRPWPVRPPA